jgi:hypothetical protein
MNPAIRLLGVFIIATAGLLLSCKKNSETEASFFLKADPVKVSTTAAQGSSSHNITDIWLYVDGQFQGAYPTGKLMPVVTKNKSVRIEAFAGIKNNGIADTRIPWFLYQKLQYDTLISTGQHIVRPFTFSYNPNVSFSWVEDFEGDAGVTLIKSPISEVGYVLSTAENSFEGRSIEMELNSAQIIAQLESTKSFTLPTANSNVYLELNYKCNTKFEVGVFGTGTSEKAAIILNPKESWNKIYIQLAGVVNSEPKAPTYKVYFRMINSGANPKVQLDNIKLLYL